MVIDGKNPQRILGTVTGAGCSLICRLRRLNETAQAEPLRLSFCPKAFGTAKSDIIPFWSIAPINKHHFSTGTIGGEGEWSCVSNLRFGSAVDLFPPGAFGYVDTA